MLDIDAKFDQFREMVGGVHDELKKETAKAFLRATEKKISRGGLVPKSAYRDGETVDYSSITINRSEFVNEESQAFKKQQELVDLTRRDGWHEGTREDTRFVESVREIIEAACVEVASFLEQETQKAIACVSRHVISPDGDMLLLFFDSPGDRDKFREITGGGDNPSHHWWSLEPVPIATTSRPRRHTEYPQQLENMDAGKSWGWWLKKWFGPCWSK